MGYSVVTSLSQSIKGHWYRVFFDNFFTSYKLLEDLYANKILGCGTMRQGCKGFPRELFDKENLKQMKRGDTMWRMKGPILATAWMDKKAVFVSGTVCSAPPDQLPEVQRRQKDGTHQNVPCPPIISTYNQYMGGVDKNDQMRSYYPIPAFGKKWWSRIFYDLIDRSIFNAFVLEQESPNHNKRTLKDFRIAIAKELIGDFSSRRKRGRASLDALEARYTERHFPEYLPSNEAGKILLRRCKVCYDNGTVQEREQVTVARIVMCPFASPRAFVTTIRNSHCLHKNCNFTVQRLYYMQKNFTEKEMIQCSSKKLLYEKLVIVMPLVTLNHFVI